MKQKIDLDLVTKLRAVIASGENRDINLRYMVHSELAQLGFTANDFDSDMSRMMRVKFGMYRSGTASGAVWFSKDVPHKYRTVEFRHLW